jgi:hypothetical protein
MEGGAASARATTTAVTPAPATMAPAAPTTSGARTTPPRGADAAAQA